MSVLSFTARWLLQAQNSRHTSLVTRHLLSHRPLPKLGPVARGIAPLILPLSVRLFPGFLGGITLPDVVLHEVGQQPRLPLPGFGVPGAQSVRAGEAPGFIQQVFRVRRRELALFLRRPAS